MTSMVLGHIFEVSNTRGTAGFTSLLGVTVWRVSGLTLHHWAFGLSPNPLMHGLPEHQVWQIGCCRLNRSQIKADPLSTMAQLISTPSELWQIAVTRW